MATSSSASSASNERTILGWLDRFFRARGFSAAQAKIAEAGFLGNFQVESGFNPAAYNPRENARGIGQWEGGRLSAGLAPYAAAHHLSVTSLQADLGYLGQELSGPYSRVVSSLRTASSPAAAATIVDTQFEGSAGTTRGARISNAQSIYSQLLGGGLTGTSYDLVDPGNGAATSLPYPANISGPLSGAQRTGIIGYLESAGMNAQNIGLWLAHGVNSLIPVNLADYESAGAKDNRYDKYLEQAYAAAAAGTPIQIGKTKIEWHSPIGNPVDAIVGDIETAAKDIGHSLFTFGLNALLVIVGIVGLIIALVMLSHADDGTTSGTPIAPSSSPGESSKQEATGGGGGEAEAGEVAAAG
jgi:hypothetical protein